MLMVRHAVPSDVESLMDLSRRWQRENLSSLSRGFLSADLSLETCEGVIERGEAVGAFEGRRAVGYYLLNPAPKFHVLHDIVTRRRMNRGELPRSARVGHSTQGVIEPEYRGRGLLAQMVDVFCRMLQGRYDIVASTVDVRNSVSLRAHRKVGFRVVDSVGEHHVISRPVVVPAAVIVPRPARPRLALAAL